MQVRLERFSKFRLGSLWMLVAGLLFAGMGVFVKLGGAHFSSAEMVFYRSIFGVVMVLSVMHFKRLAVRTPHWRLHVGRSVAGFGGMMLLFYVIGILPLSTATTLNYTSPLFMVVLSTLVLRRRPQPWLVVAVVLGFVGVVLLLQPSFGAGQTVAGLLGLASGLCASVAYLTTTELGRLGEPAWRIVLYFAAVSTLGAAIFALAGGGFRPIDRESLLVLLGLGLSATLGQLAMTRAYADGETLTVGSLAYSTVVFTTLLSILIWRDAVSITSWLAITLIIASGVLATRITAEAAPAAAPPA
ncbi:MAG TPA: DMT family transporter [Rubrivivax sp.]|nr:DMT family transporter [Rubrivivax sp.]